MDPSHWLHLSDPKNSPNVCFILCYTLKATLNHFGEKIHIYSQSIYFKSKEVCQIVSLGEHRVQQQHFSPAKKPLYLLYSSNYDIEEDNIEKKSQ